MYSADMTPAKTDTEPADIVYQHTSSSADKRMCERCGAFVADGHCVVPPPPAEDARMARAYAYLTEPLDEAGAGPRLLRTGNGWCYVIQVELADGAVIQIGSDAGPLGTPKESGRTLEAVWYEVEEATAGEGRVIATASPENAAPLIRQILRLVDAAQHTADTSPLELISREQAEAWAGRALTNEMLAELAKAIPHSSIPDAISTIIESIAGAAK